MERRNPPTNDNVRQPGNQFGRLKHSRGAAKNPKRHLNRAKIGLLPRGVPKQASHGRQRLDPNSCLRAAPLWPSRRPDSSGAYRLRNEARIEQNPL